MHIFTHLKPESQGKTGLGLYPDGMVEHDGHVGQILDKLKELGLEDNTIVMYSTDNGAECFSWPDGGTTPFRGEKNENWEGGYRVPCAIRWPGVIKPGTVNNDLFSHEDMLPTLLAAVGVPDVKEQLLKGMKVGKKTFKVHLDGYNIMDRLAGKGPNPRNEFFYWNDDGSLVGLRFQNWKVVFQEQRSHGFDVWQDPFTPLRLPKIINLRSDPFERAEHESIGYARWRVDRTYLLVPAQEYIAKYIGTFKDFPPSQKVGSFSLDQVLDNLTAASTGEAGGRRGSEPATSLEAAVKDFYERYPYPRPIDDLDNYRRRWQDPGRRRADFFLFWPDKPYTETRTILVAGCGTSQAAKHAARCPAAKVVGIDFSATSVRHTEGLRRKYGLTNLEVHQLPIDRVGDLKMTFDEIVCTGVLHHLANPEAALRALRDVLDPDGAMQLMVYAPYGRAGIYMLQEFCRRIGIQASDDEIRDLIVALGALPAGHPLARLLREAPDFRQEAALADALLHPQDRAYSVPQLLGFISGAGLTFSRWVRQAPYSPHCGVMARVPQTSRIAALEPAQQYAAAELFRGTMMSHSVIARRDDRPGHSRLISFSGDAWLDYVPVRVPDTLCVQERLPPGAAAVLINRAHTDTDIYLPIDEREKRLVDAIDGERGIGEIVGDERRDFCCALFERLWWHDQVVFDGSRRR